MISDYLHAIFVALLFTPLVALVVQYLAKWLVRFRPRYVSALGSVATSCVVRVSITFSIAQLFAPPHPLSLAAVVSNDPYPTKQFIGDVAAFCAGFAVSSACHKLIIRGPNGERLTLSKAIQLAGAQTLAVLLIRVVLHFAL